jgi:ABC-type phosphate/phosphonate transport system substrate-binding protein
MKQRSSIRTGAAVISLPMYDWPEVRGAMDALWEGLRRHLGGEGVAVPVVLDRRADYAGVWADPGLVLSQTCGYPYVRHLRGQVQLVATPCYAAPGCRGPNYSSFILVARGSRFRAVEDLRHARAAINSEDSQSGYSALRAVVAPHAKGGRFFGEVIRSGGHRASLQAVAEGKADVCATDAVCAALARRHLPDLMKSMRIIARSPQAPALPLITAGDATPERIAALRRALQAVIADKALAAARKELLLAGFEALDDRAYERIVRIEERAKALGYPKVA